jgi:hypothetical protein
MSNIEKKDIQEMKNEIKKLLSSLEKKETLIIGKIEKNMYNILIFKSYLENIIEEYHLICKKIYN